MFLNSYLETTLINASILEEGAAKNDKQALGISADQSEINTEKSKSKILSLVDSPRYAPPMRDYIPHTKRRVTEENKTKDA